MVRAADADGIPWGPEDLPVPRDQLRSWSYVVLEEIVDDVALLRRWAWPVVDQLGRLVWPSLGESGTQTAVVDLGLLVVQLYRPTELWRRPRCGDVFAVESVGRGWRRSGDRDLVDVASLFDGEVYDVSAAAREAAKLAYLASVAPVMQLDATDETTRASVAAAMEERSRQRAPAVTVVVLDGTPPTIGRRGRRPRT
jgi:hypothetical protein